MTLTPTQAARNLRRVADWVENGGSDDFALVRGQLIETTHGCSLIAGGCAIGHALVLAADNTRDCRVFSDTYDNRESTIEPLYDLACGHHIVVGILNCVPTLFDSGKRDDLVCAHLRRAADILELATPEPLEPAPLARPRHQPDEYEVDDEPDTDETLDHALVPA